jgi:hypothetical protein
MDVQGWLIVGGTSHSETALPPQMYVGETVGALPNAANFKVGQWMLWRPVAALVAGTSTQMPVVCVRLPL